MKFLAKHFYFILGCLIGQTIGIYVFGLLTGEIPALLLPLYVLTIPVVWLSWVAKFGDEIK